MSHSTIYKILTLEEFNTFKKNKKFEGNPLDLKDGYMHFSMKNQYPHIIEKYFLGQKVIVLEVSIENLNGILKIESNSPNGEQYPHLYNGCIAEQDVVAVIHV